MKQRLDMRRSAPASRVLYQFLETWGRGSALSFGFSKEEEDEPSITEYD
jgi:hypothetical protein